jgi:predicted nuclease of predicted toxin-antitoxin system
MKIVADESVDFGIILRLRQKSIEVISIAEDNCGIKDDEVLNISLKYNCLLITEDKDFGELTYRLKLEHKGILLVRLNDIPRNERIELVAELIEKHFDEINNNFSVIDKRGLRIKTGQTRSK